MLRTTEFGFLALLCCACSSSSPTDPPCVQGLTPSCAATYAPPTYSTIFTSILQPNCAVGTGTCHTADVAMAGLAFANADTAYAELLGQNGNKPRVIPGDPGCSLLMKRLESTDPSYRMPKGNQPLSAGDLCTIVQWISQGAQR